MARFRTVPAPDLVPLVHDLVAVLGFDHIDPGRVHMRRSRGSTSDAYARIWELPSIWSETLDVPPQYVIEVLAEHFDGLDETERTKIVIHELLHIPSTFSGALRNHRGQGEPINGHTVTRYYRRYRAAVAEREAAARDPQLSLFPAGGDPRAPVPS
jgi:predicted metallopeptidase